MKRVLSLTIALSGMMALSSPAFSEEAKATFAGGCFWCMEGPFDKLQGVKSTTSGYMGGTLENPSYEDVTYGDTGHKEVVQVIYDPALVSYDELLDVYWRNVDPFDDGGQFCDRGESYETGIFAHDAEQLAKAVASKQVLEERFGKPLVTEIEEAPAFWPAEDYHQDYYINNPLRYTYYRTACGRDRRLEQVWGDEAPKS